MDGRSDRITLLERFIVVFAWLGALLSGAGTLLAIVPGPVADPGLAVALAGLLATALAAFASMPVDTLRHLRADVTGGSAYDRLRGQRPLRIASALLSLLVVVGAFLLILTGGSASGAFGVDVGGPVIDRASLILAAALAVTIAAAHLQSLRTPVNRDRSVAPVTLAAIAFGVAAVAALAGVVAWLGGSDSVDPWVHLHRDDVPSLLLGGFVLLAFGLARSRTLPGLPSILGREREALGGSTAAARNTGVLLPAIMAFALLIVVFLLVLLFGVGVGDLILTVGDNPLLLGILLFLLASLIASVAIGLKVAKSAEKEEPLFKELTDAKRRTVRWILIASGSLGGILLLLAYLAFNEILFAQALWLHFLCVGLMVLLGPFGFWAQREHTRIRKLEERFPDFLRDIASSHKGGLTLHQSVTIAARGEYGPLTPEVRKMADQLSWNVSFHEALERFAERVQTPLVQRAVSLILQADRSGGSTTDVLLAAARDAREIKNLETERRLTMSLYTVVVYITFFVFLGVAAVLYARFAPEIVASTQAVSDLGTVGPVGGLGAKGLSLEQFRLFYFIAAIVQGIGDGILAGLLGSGRVRLGLRHSFYMVVITYVTFALVLA